MNYKNPKHFRASNVLTVSEIGRYVKNDLDSDKYSSGDSYRPSSNESSDEDESFDNNTLQSSYVADLPMLVVLHRPRSPSPMPGRSADTNNVTPPTLPQVTHRHNKQPQRVLQWNDLPQLKTYIFNEPVRLKVPPPGNSPID